MSSPPPYHRPSYEVARHGGKADPVDRGTASVPDRGSAGFSDRDLVEEPVAPEVRRTALKVRLVVAGLAVLALGVTALLGGFDQVVTPPSPDALPVVPVGQQVNGGPWLVTVESAQIGANLRDYHPSSAGEGDLVLQVNVRIDIVDTRSTNLLHVIELRPFTGLSAESTSLNLRDNTLVLHGQPGLPVRVAYLWTVAKGSPVPTEVTVVILGKVRRYQNFRFLGQTIEIEDSKATVVVPVLNRTAAA